MAKRDLILLALEDSSITKMMDSVLHAVRYETAIATDTAALSRILQESNAALLLLGENFDGHDGLKISQELLERFPTLPILIYTQKPSVELTRGIFRLGLSGYISPPLKTDDIISAVENSLRNAHRVGDWLRREVQRTTASLQKRAQISESERSRLESVFNNIHDSVMILDNDKKILLANPAMCKAFGLDQKSAVGKPALEVLTHPDMQALVTLTTDDDPLKYHEVNFADGRVSNAQIASVRDVGYAITMQDITNLKEIDRMRSEFVNTVSHDLRSPLTSVIGYAELVERAGSLNENQRDFLKRIQDSVQHITALINDLLDLGSIEAGMDIRREYTQLESVLHYTLEMLHGQIKSKRIKVNTEVAPSMPALRANPIRLRQILDNVVGNAIKYSHANGEVKISIHSEGEQVILQVTDQGPGISLADQPHIFDKFYRGSDVSSDIVGSGLGLAIVKTIVENHQGRIWLESTLGKGSSFFIVLPIHEQPVQITKK
ncbi:MAG TPA: ATP-binding protein [Anaerolineales bacterium]|nr:ATP-binding protein [Anaerolineales bacterium]